MTKQEYENLTNTRVSYEDYKNIIEPMYMATNLSKQEFVKTINAKQFDVPEEKDSILIIVEIPWKCVNSKNYGGHSYYAKCYDWDLATRRPLVELLDCETQEEVKSKLESLPFGCKPPIRTVRLKECLNIDGEEIKDDYNFKDRYEELANEQLDSFMWHLLF